MATGSSVGACEEGHKKLIRMNAGKSSPEVPIEVQVTKTESRCAMYWGLDLSMPRAPYPTHRPPGPRAARQKFEENCGVTDASVGNDRYRFGRGLWVRPPKTYGLAPPSQIGTRNRLRPEALFASPAFLFCSAKIKIRSPVSAATPLPVTQSAISPLSRRMAHAASRATPCQIAVF